MKNASSASGKRGILKNMGIIGVGVFLTKIINFLIAPVFSYFLTTSEYGVIDVLVTTISLLLPLLTLEIQQAIIKYCLSDPESTSVYFSNGFLVNSIGSIAIGLTAFLATFFIYSSLRIPLILYYVSYASFVFLQSFAKSIKRTGIYAISSVIYCLLTIGPILFFLMVPKLSIEGYLYGMAIGAFVASFFVFFALRCWRLFRWTNLKGKVLAK